MYHRFFDCLRWPVIGILALVPFWLRAENVEQTERVAADREATCILPLQGIAQDEEVMEVRLSDEHVITVPRDEFREVRTADEVILGTSGGGVAAKYAITPDLVFALNPEMADKGIPDRLNVITGPFDLVWQPGERKLHLILGSTILLSADVLVGRMEQKLSKSMVINSVPHRNVVLGLNAYPDMPILAGRLAIISSKSREFDHRYPTYPMIEQAMRQDHLIIPDKEYVMLVAAIRQGVSRLHVGATMVSTSEGGAADERRDKPR